MSAQTRGKSSTSQKTRAKLNHPVIDSDGHFLELMPVFLDYVKKVGGADIAKKVEAERSLTRTYRPLSNGEQLPGGAWRPSWWIATANTYDYATGALPKLMYQRMDELGIDFSVLYPTMNWNRILDTEMRQVLTRSANTYAAEQYQEYRDRITVPAFIPTQTPEEGIAELDFAVGKLGLKAVQINSFAMREYPWVNKELAPRDYVTVCRPDVYAIGSDFDYDPFWEKCAQLKVAVGSHSTTAGFGFRRSPLMMYNNVGHFSVAGEALSKALFFGGVTKRFPQLRFAFLEGGVGWACDLYSGIVGRWHKRGGHVIKRLDPTNLNKERLIALTKKYGSPEILSKLPELSSRFGEPLEAPANLDDFSAAGIKSVNDIHDRFVPNFYFGCEADDPMNAWAFNAKVNPAGARLNAIFGSDVSHWDVPDMRDTVHEAYELVEHELITEADFKDFVFANSVRLHAGLNKDFFKGTRVESAAAKVLASAKPPAKKSAGKR